MPSTSSIRISSTSRRTGSAGGPMIRLRHPRDAGAGGSMDQAFRDAIAGRLCAARSRARRHRQRDARRRDPHRDPGPGRPVSMLNRHGLIAGATGTGKTKTLQLLAGQLSKAGVPCLRGRHQGRPDRPRRARRRRPTRRSSSASSSLGWTFAPSGHPVEFLSLIGQARRPGAGHASTRSGRCCSARSSTSTRPRPRSWRWSSSTATTTTCRCST